MSPHQTPRPIHFTFEAIEEARAGPRWQAHFQRHWDGYRKWFLSEGDAARPSYLESRRRLGAAMPEMLPLYDHLVELAGGGDMAARLLSLYRPPPYLTGCSQAVWIEGDEPVLVRNYDYHPDLLEGALLRSEWLGRPVIAMLDCLWGVLDGMNGAGLVVSLAFGGRTQVGDGFGIPVVLRQVLETCDNTEEAVELLKRIPAHMAYNVTVLDRAGRFKTVYLSPDRAAAVRQFPVATNHQGRVEWLEHAHATATLERERFLFERFADNDETVDGFIDSFLGAPLLSRAYRRGYGTLYTAVYWPRRGVMELRWPGAVWRQGLANFVPGVRHVEFHDASAPDKAVRA